MSKEQRILPYDEDLVKDFIVRFFEIQREINILKEDLKVLKDEFKGKINQTLINKLISKIKLELQLTKENVSEETIISISELIKDKLNMVI